MRKNGPYREGTIHVQHEMCETCIFRPGNLMHLNRGRVAGMVRSAKAKESCIICHETLGDHKQSVCRGFFDRHATFPLQIAERLNMITFTGKEDKKV
jgi:hypothetical protein